MRYPSLTTMRIMTADRRLFEHTMRRLGLRLARRNNDPLETNVQTEAVVAIASVMSESLNDKVTIPPYFRHLKEMAERCGYVVMFEGPAWHRDDQYQALERDARDLGMSDPSLAGDPEEEMDINAPMSFGPGAGLPKPPATMMPNPMDTNNYEEEPTGPDALNQIVSDLDQLDAPNLTEPW